MRRWMSKFAFIGVRVICHLAWRPAGCAQTERGAANNLKTRESGLGIHTVVTWVLVMLMQC